MDFDRFEEADLAALPHRSGAKWARCPPGVLAAWVADMDFPLAEPVAEALRGMVDRSDVGYPCTPGGDGLATEFSNRMDKRFGWLADPAQVEVLTDVVQGLHLAVELFSERGDGVVTPLPIYPPFLEAVEPMGRRAVWMRFERSGRGYEIDFDQLERSIDRRTRLLLLCNPHNPTGRVLREAELRRLADLALAHDLVVVSDEIHADLVYPGARHVPIASLDADIAARTMTLASATKAFNFAGLRCAVAHFGSSDLRRRFRQVHHHARGGVNAMGLAATLAAWRHGDQWLAAVVSYLEGNRDLVVSHAEASWPGVACAAIESTYLAWLDCRGAGLPGAPHRVLLDEAKVMLSVGSDFGQGCEAFTRINFATPRPLLCEILGRMDRVLARRR